MAKVYIVADVGRTLPSTSLRAGLSAAFGFDFLYQV